MASAAMALKIWISRVSKLGLRIVKHYGSTCVSTIIAVGISLSIMQNPAAAEAGPQFCVLVPHFKDEYWLSVGFGLEQEAERQNVTLWFFEAGGYRARATQIEQLDDCVTRGANAILIGAVTSDHPDLLGAVARAAQNTPVFGLVNALHSEVLTGRVGVDWQMMGYAVGHHLSLRHPAGSPPKTAVFLTGPNEAGWTGPLEKGLRDALAQSAVEIREVFGGDTGLRAQLNLVETALIRHKDADYLIGNAPAIEAAFGLFATQIYPDPPMLLSTYVNHSVLRGLLNGQVVAAAFDDPVQQGILAIQQAMDAPTSSKTEGMIGPEIVLLSGNDQSVDHIRMSPADYFPAVR